MPIASSQQICVFSLNHILTKGTQQVSDNKIIKQNIQKYSTKQSFANVHDLLLQAGAQNQSNRYGERIQKMPNSLQKDVHCFRSVHVSPKGVSSKISSQRLNRQSRVSRARTNNWSFNKSNNNLQVNTKKQKKFKKQESNKFIEVPSFENQEINGKKITQYMIKQKNVIQTQRQRICSEDKVRRKHKKMQQEYMKKQSQRLQQIKQKMQLHQNSNKTNSVSFDLNGQVLLVKGFTKQQSLKRRYPPSKISFSFQQQQQNQNIQNDPPMSIRERAARGQAFSSAVLRTVNMSKFSLNLSSKTCNMDELTYMKRNDLFNNNHTRQVTTIPYLQVTEGAKYSESNINQSVDKRSTRNTSSHTQTKSKFKTYSVMEIGSIKPKTADIANIQHHQNQNEKKRVQSCRMYSRPKTCDVAPKSAQISGRINTINKGLVQQLFQ